MGGDGGMKGVERGFYISFSVGIQLILAGVFEFVVVVVVKKNRKY